MTNAKSTRRALVTSALAVLMCVAMLIGTTFAWFTDSASTGVNKIQAGNLKMQVSYKNTSDGEFKILDENTNVFKEDALWEPGHVEYAVLNVKNIGTLALKYKLGINIISETGSTNVNGKDFKLSDYIKFAVIDGEADVTDRAALVTAAEAADSKLIKEGYSKESQLKTATDTNEALKNDETVTLVVWMPETVGNDANYKVGAAVPEINLGIGVYATQYTYEEDSFGDDYDANATYYPVIDAAGLKDALKVGGNVTLADDVAVVPDVDTSVENYKLFEQMTVTKDTTIDLSGKKIAFDVAEGTDFAKACPLLMAVNGGTLTINGDGEINCDAAGNNAYGININGGNVVINGGKYYGAITAIQIQKGSLEINGGFFDMTDDCKATVPGYAKYIINCIDKSYKDGTATISVKGGTFVNFDPSDNPEGAGTTYVANGYDVISETRANGDVWYTVVKGNVTTLTPDTVNTSGIYHSDGTFYLSAGDYGEFTATLEQSYKNVTFLASENAKFKGVTIRYHGGDPADATISAKGDSTLTVKGFHVSGNISISSFDKNVTVEDNDAASIALKTYHVADMDVQFLNNDLGAGTAGNGYGIYFVPNTTNYDLTITGNTFTGTGSHAIAVQGYGDGKAETAAKSVTVKGNTFNSYGVNGGKNRAAFKIWADTKLAPAEGADLSSEAKLLIESVKNNNTFASDLGTNCVAGNFYDTIAELN